MPLPKSRWRQRRRRARAATTAARRRSRGRRVRRGHHPAEEARGDADQQGPAERGPHDRAARGGSEGPVLQRADAQDRRGVQRATRLHAGGAEGDRRLYEVEHEAKEHGLDADGRRELRQRVSKVVLDELKPWLEALRPHVLPKSPMGDAIGYALRQWGPLTRFLDDGRLEIDNNRVERQMRTVAVGRKNWMFAGSVEGGHRAATIYSLVCTCGLLGIEPWAYLKDVLQRLAEGADPAQLTPRLWKAAHTTPA